MAHIQNPNLTIADKDGCRATELSFVAGGAAKPHSPSGRELGSFL